MKNKGFTLVELLAVILVLAIIALIAVPTILNTLEDSKISAGITSAKMYSKAVDNGILNRKLETGKSVSSGTYGILPDGNVCLDEVFSTSCEDILYVDAKNYPTSGTITINNGIVENYDFLIDGSEHTYIGDNRGSNEGGSGNDEPLINQDDASWYGCYKFSKATNTIVDYSTDSSCSKQVSIPDKIDNVTVTTIGDEAFKDKGLTRISFPSTITSVGRDIIRNNSNLTNISLGSCPIASSLDSFLSASVFMATGGVTYVYLPQNCFYNKNSFSLATSCAEVSNSVTVPENCISCCIHRNTGEIQ